jgi:hypothetical protein
MTLEYALHLSFFKESPFSEINIEGKKLHDHQKAMKETNQEILDLSMIDARARSAA